jgi:type IV pilus assembly protein PilY1
MNLAVPMLISLLAAPALAGPDNASWNRDLERLDFYTNPPEGGDNAFFTTVVSTTSSANVTMMYMNTTSMNEFIYTLYEIRHDKGGGAGSNGCGNTFLNSRNYFMPSTGIAAPAADPTLGPPNNYQPAKTYPDPITTYSGGPTDHFVSGSAYQYLNWNLGGNALPAPGAQTPSAACSNVIGNMGSDISNCTTCLSTKGYWLNPKLPDNDTSINAGVFMGNFLNFYPPKWVMMDLAFRRLEQNGILNTLRTSVAGANGLVGAKSLQKMLPQSCQGQGRPKGQALGSLDDIQYSSTGHPLAEALFNVAWYLGGQTSPWVFSNTATFSGTAIADGSKSAPCNGCNGNFTLIFSDGRGDSGNPLCHPDGLGNVPPNCRAKAANCYASDGTALGLGAEGDGNDYLDPSLAGGAGTLISGSSVRLTPPGTCEYDFADDVATWMATHDVSATQTGSRVSVFAIGLGPNPLLSEDTYGRMRILQIVAQNGNGQYIPANDYSTLESGVFSAIGSIIKSSTSFSTAAITTVQTRAQTSAFIPRFIPGPDNAWMGRLFRFGLFNEFTAGCGPKELADGGVKDALNPNGNASCTDVYLQDSNSQFIGETSSGSFVQVDWTQPYDFDGGGFPIKYVANPDGGPSTTIPAAPYWEASDVLTHQVNQQAMDGGVVPPQRAIYTVIPDSTGGYGPVPQPLTTTSADAFTVANVATLTPLLKLNGSQSSFCSNLSISTRHTYTADTAGEQACATDLINYMLGQDVMLQDPTNRQNGATTAARPKILGDIFHSSPILITPPVMPMYCKLGFLTQCIETLFAEGYTQVTPGGNAAYNTYQTGAAATRQQLLLVGANDGLIHAFDAGQGTGTGTGAELWAFIPPDMLPKLQRYVLGGRHEVLVDGTPMVRDIWVDGGATGVASQRNGKKEANEYHTVAIVPEREGGHFYTALDVTDTKNPQFLWSWPPAGSTESLAVGETWDDHAPTPPPIGPVLIDDVNGPIVPSGGAAGGSGHAREAYIVAVGGGFDPNFIRGRGIYVLDAWTGTEYYRFAREDSKGSADPVNNLYPVAGTVALLDTDYDYIFDTLVVGDVGGQLWTITLKSAGKSSSGSGLFDNWFGGRSFVQFKGQALYKRSPFFAISSVQNMSPSSQPFDNIRVMVGSGDRDHIKDIGGATCGLANLRACIRKDCAVDIKTASQRVGAPPVGSGAGHSVTGELSYTSGSTALSIDNYLVDQTTLNQSVASTDAVDASYQTTVTCGGTTTNYSNTAYCDWGATTAGLECPTATGRPLATVSPGTSSVTQENAEFYAVRLYGDSLGGATSSSSNRPLMLTYAQAQTYDQNAFTETDLTDVTTAGATGGATATSNGWRYKYTSADEKSANGALILPGTGCVIWSSLVPTAATVQCGGTIPPDTANSYISNVVNGGTSCGGPGTPTVRYTSRPATVAPPPYTAVLSVNANQQYAITGISLQPGVAPQTINGAIGDLSNFRYWLEVPRAVHDCRHAGTCQ